MLRKRDSDEASRVEIDCFDPFGFPRLSLACQISFPLFLLNGGVEGPRLHSAHQHLAEQRLDP